MEIKGKQNKNAFAILLAIGFLVVWNYVWKKARTTDERAVGGGCLDPNASNYNPNAVFDNGSCHFMTQGCCNTTASNYDSGCATDSNCQCSNQACIMVTGRTACCNTLATEYDPTCLGDPDCTCDSGMCLTSPATGGRTSCCSIGNLNYDSTCHNDPQCTCDNSLCLESPSAHTCYTNCIGTGFQSIITTLPCGTGAVQSYSLTNAPYCAGTGGA